MSEYRPRFTDQEIYDLYSALDMGIERAVKNIHDAEDNRHAVIFYNQAMRFTELYIKIRSLNGYRAAGVQRAVYFRREAATALDLKGVTP